MFLLRASRSLAVACAFAATVFGQSDLVKIRKSGEVKEEADVVVIQDDVKAVKAKRGPATLSFPVHDVVEVVYGKRPETFKNAMAKFAARDFEKALPLFEEALAHEDDLKTYGWLGNYALWHVAQCAELLGDLQKAYDAYNELVAKHPNSRFAPDALMSAGEMSVEVKAYDKAQTLFTRLSELAKKEGLGEFYAMKAQLGLLLVKAASGGGGDVVSELEQLAAKAASDFPEVAGKARLAVGQAAVKKKDFTKAEAVFRAIVSAPGVADRVWAGAANGLADVQYEQAKYLDAAFSYSKVYGILFGDAESDPALAKHVGWALYRGGKSSELHAGGLQNSDPNRATWSRRGRFLMKEAVRRFRNTPGGSEAAKELGIGQR
jgi:TolA-binding protein